MIFLLIHYIFAKRVPQPPKSHIARHAHTRADGIVGSFKGY